MGKLVEMAARLVIAARQSYARKWSFLVVFLCFFSASIVILAALDLLPEPKTVAEASTELIEEAPAPAAPAAVREMPLTIAIPKISLSATIKNPATTDIKTLDAALHHGAVRYPTSAQLGEDGNVVLFGHSSYLPIVNNQAYKTFNGIQKLVPGDLVTVSSSGTSYTYRVRSMKKESAETAGIPLQVSGRVLTLSTCDSFGTKSDRFVVVADFVESHPVGS